MLQAALVVGGIGVVAALVLGVASRVFYVYVDPRIAQVEEALLGANCGGCGYAGCAQAAEAVVKGRAGVDVCVAGGPPIAERVAAVMGVSVVGGEKRIAELGCKYGIDDAVILFDYDGIDECRAADLVAGGGKVCTMGCLGHGTCVEACPFDALYMGEDGLPHVIEDKCTGCGTCERVCPQGIIRVNSPSRRFLHVQTSDDCVAPCQATCPAQINIPAYIKAISEGEYLEAVRIIKESNPFPLVCGRVCPHPCESACRRADIDEPININHLKRFAADYEMLSGQHIVPEKLPSNGKSVGIVGSGPSGLTCAYYLARLGYQVTVYEAMPKPGGMLRYGIPEYRLPKKVLDWEIGTILELGVELKCNTRIGQDVTLAELHERHDALYLAIGAWDSRRMGVEGERDFPEVLSGTEFLVRLGLGERPELGKNVVIVGGGNTAMDAARTSLRLGAENVYLLYRRSRKEMPANDIEVEEAELEGVQYHFLSAPKRFIGEDGHLKEMEYIRMELGEPDASGRRRPVPVPGSEQRMPVDNVLAAIGQTPKLDLLHGDPLGERIGTTRWKSIVAENGTYQTAVKDVFAGGDAWRGPATAVEAIRDGRFAARGIHLLLSGEEPSLPENWYRRPPKLPGVDPEVAAEFIKLERVKMPELPVEERRLSFKEVELGLSEEQARKEAARCLQCGEVCYRGYRSPEIKEV